VTIAELRKQAADEGINETGFYVKWLENKLLPFLTTKPLLRKKKVAIMRYATIMEDEGQETYIKNFDTKLDAEKWIARQKGEYFGPGDYYIIGE
jgi:hypothetical protein